MGVRQLRSDVNPYEPIQRVGDISLGLRQHILVDRKVNQRYQELSAAESILLFFYGVFLVRMFTPLYCRILGLLFLSLRLGVHGNKQPIKVALFAEGILGDELELFCKQVRPCVQVQVVKFLLHSGVKAEDGAEHAMVLPKHFPNFLHFVGDAVAILVLPAVIIVAHNEFDDRRRSTHDGPVSSKAFVLDFPRIEDGLRIRCQCPLGPYLRSVRVKALFDALRVPAACWPTYPCTEHGGLGWTALVTTLQRPNAAIVRFVEASDDRGLPFADVKLDLTVLIPF